MSGRVPPGPRAGRRARGAISRASSADLRQAARLYERFSGEPGAEFARLPLRTVGDGEQRVAVAVGTLDGLLYTTVRDGKIEKYIHKFNVKDKPLFAVSPDGRAIYIIGGRFRFTERGIVDTSDRSY